MTLITKESLMRDWGTTDGAQDARNGIYDPNFPESRTYVRAYDEAQNRVHKEKGQ